MVLILLVGASIFSPFYLYLAKFLRVSILIFNITEHNPVKNANWWTKWKRKSIKYQSTAERNKSTLLYLLSLAILTAGASYAAVPLYRMFCQATSYGGTTKVGHDTEKVEKMEPQKERLITVKFTADTAATMQWNFKPQQYSINLYAGETALAFYTVSKDIGYLPGESKFCIFREVSILFVLDK